MSPVAPFVFCSSGSEAALVQGGSLSVPGCGGTFLLSDQTCYDTLRELLELHASFRDIVAFVFVLEAAWDKLLAHVEVCRPDMAQVVFSSFCLLRFSF